jgi:intein/homing endonuclease
MDLINEEIYAYLAGFLDADGSITIVNRNIKGKPTRYRVQICVYNCNILIINKLKHLFGGKIRSNNVNSSYSKWRNCFVYSLSDSQAINVIKNIYPYLIIKKRQADIALQIAEVRSEANPAERRWNKEIANKINDSMLRLKAEINKLNIRGTEKIFSKIDVSSIPYNKHYLAGFCDADGSIMITKMGKGVAARITFTNTDKNILEWIRFHKGGANIETRNHGNDKWNLGYSLRFYPKTTYLLAQELYPHLILKKRQAKLVLTLGKIRKLYSSVELQNNIKLNERCHSLNEKLKTICSKLNKRSF